ncbi:hypothetical protein L208DRAFT_1396461, partial [Tricholoma matsutake]
MEEGRHGSWAAGGIGITPFLATLNGSEGMFEMGIPGSKLWHHSGITTAATCGCQSHGHIATISVKGSIPIAKMDVNILRHFWDHPILCTITLAQLTTYVWLAAQL